MIGLQARRAAVLGDFADDESIKMKEALDHQADAAILQFHTRTADIRKCAIRSLQ